MYISGLAERKVRNHSSHTLMVWMGKGEFIVLQMIIPFFKKKSEFRHILLD